MLDPSVTLFFPLAASIVVDEVVVVDDPVVVVVVISVVVVVVVGRVVVDLVVVVVVVVDGLVVVISDNGVGICPSGMQSWPLTSLKDVAHWQTPSCPPFLIKHMCAHLT